MLEQEQYQSLYISLHHGKAGCTFGLLKDNKVTKHMRDNTYRITIKAQLSI